MGVYFAASIVCMLFGLYLSVESQVSGHPRVMFAGMFIGIGIGILFGATALFVFGGCP